MGRSDGKVTINTALNNKGLINGIKNIAGSMGGLKPVLREIGGIVATAFSVKAIIDFSRESIELGSNLEEVQNVVNVSFGSMASAAEDFAATAITKFGMSELAAKQTASTYMAMAKGMGVAESIASDMSIALAGLSGDVASFYNLDQQDAAKKLQGVFTGESEALKSLGVVMTQTNLKQFALEKGMNANIEAMSQAELVALRYAFVTDALSLAAGDFENTQYSWANQTRILSMQWQQFMGIIGQTLTTVLLPTIKVLNSLVSVLISVSQRIQSVVAGLFGKTATQTSAVAESASGAAEATEDLEKATEAAGKAAKKSLAGFDELNTLADQSGGAGASGATSSISTETVTVGGEVNDQISPAIQRIIDKINRLIQPLKNINLEPAKKAFDGLMVSISNFGNVCGGALLWAWENVLVPLATWTIEEAAPAALNLLSGAFDLLTSVITALQPSAQWLWDNFLEPLAQWAGQTIVDTINALADALKAISDWITENQELVEGFVIVVGSFAAAWGLVNGAIAAWNAAVALWNSLGAIAAAVTAAFSAAVNFLLSPVTLITLAIGALIAIIVLLIRNWDDVKEFAVKCWEGIKAAWETVADWFDENIVQPVADFFSDLWTDISTRAVEAWGDIKATFSSIGSWIDTEVVQPVSEFFSNLWTGFSDKAAEAWESVKTVFGKVGSFFSETFEKAWAGIVKIFSTGGEIFVDIKDGILTAFKDVVNGIIKGLNSAIAVPFNGINRALEKIKKVDVAGITPFSWLKTIAVPKIPYLAQGAVLPPNKPFLAMVGDQHNGTNVEAPLTTIQEAVAIVMQDFIASNMAGHEATVAMLREILEAILGIQIGDDVIAAAYDRYRTKMAIVNGG